MSNEKLHLFQDDEPKEPLSPSEAFRLAHPDYVEPEAVRSEWDPNARRAERQRGAGGGFAAAVAGETQVDPVQSEPAPTSHEDQIPGVAPKWIRNRLGMGDAAPTPKEDTYGDRSGASARILRASDQAYVRRTSRGM